MAKIVFFIILTQLCSNGWWYCLKYQETLTQTPICLIPFISSVAITASLIFWIAATWNDD